MPIARTQPANSGVARLRATALALVSALLMSVGALVMVPIGVITLFRARRLYSSMAAALSRMILALYGVRFEVHPAAPFPRTQVVYVSNHTSSLDMFILVALGLPNTRFFLSGFLRKFVPLGVIASMMGTFFTVPQDRPWARRRIFRRAADVLRRTRESVYLSPEGGRITSGEVGHFNKGAFHLAMDLKAPIVPLYFQIPAHVDPGRGHDARPGTVRVHVLPAIQTLDWELKDLMANVARVRSLFVQVHGAHRCA